ncbi:MAG TPA: hypothetical protein VMQ65_09080 [Candidatus Limnocylindria bacterium]|nr:hypothetical protein [Candidatus Limnocylindria bacterium]
MAAPATTLPSTAASPGANSRWPSIAELWTFLAVGLPALASLLVPMPAVDLAYQLRAGAEILAGDGIPTVDTWTFTVAGTPWLDQQWGAQVLLAAVFQAAGWTGLAILRAALVGLTFGLVLAAVQSAWSLASVRAGGSAIASSARTATLIVLGSFAVAAPALALRPQLFGIALFAATMVILAQRATHPRRLWLIPVIAAAWANLHGSFPLVIVLVGLAWLDEVALLREPIFAGQPRRRLPARLLGSTGLALIGAIAALATLANPFGIDVWQYISNLARNPEITNQVSEWRPPSPLDPSGAVFYLSLAVVLGVLVFRLRNDRRRPPARFFAPIVTVLVFGILGVITGRGLAWWALAAPVAMVALQPGLRLADVSVPGVPTLRARTAREASAIEGRRSPLSALVIALLGVVAVMLLPVWRPLGQAGVPAGVLSHAPQGIAAELRRLDATGVVKRTNPRVWNPQSWGSWLEWAVPNMHVAVDSRIELFPPELWADSNQLASGAGESLAILDRRAVDVVVLTVEQEGRLGPMLEGAHDWSRIYADGEGTIWMRATR